MTYTLNVKLFFWKTCDGCVVPLSTLYFFVFTDDEDDIDTSDLISGLQREVDLMDLAIKRERLQSLVDSDPITKSKFTTVGKAHH